jgi:hypothetical protein
MRDWSHGYLKNSIVKKKKVLSVLMNLKQKVSTFMKKKWECEKSERKAERIKHLEEYKERLMTEKDFAKQEEEKCQVEKERVKRKKIDQQNRKQREEDMNILFENFFGETRIWGPIAHSYQEKYYTAYMPIGSEMFSYEHVIVRKEDLYKIISSSSNQMTTVRLETFWFRLGPTARVQSCVC